MIHQTITIISIISFISGISFISIIAFISFIRLRLLCFKKILLSFATFSISF